MTLFNIFVKKKSYLNLMLKRLNQISIVLGHNSISDKNNKVIF